jgi:hypothetical protein
MKKMSNNKQQTAVEFYAEEFAEHLKENYGIKITNLTLLKQAKEMEKEQHENTWDDSRLEDMGDNYIGKQKSFNEYYNETYGGNK